MTVFSPLYLMVVSTADVSWYRYRRFAIRQRHSFVHVRKVCLLISHCQARNRQTLRAFGASLGLRGMPFTI